MALCAAVVSAQDETAYSAWTKSVPPQVNAVKAAIMAQATRDAAKEIAAATTPDAQNAAVTKAQGTCGGCHRVYREGAAGSYKIKS